MKLRLAVQAGRGLPVRSLHRVVTLDSKGAVVNPSGGPDAPQCSVLVVGPQGPPFRQQPVAVPFARFDTPQSRWGRLPQGQQNVRMVIVRVVAFFQHRCVNRDICHHAAADKSFPDEV
jgi:hypothetical protein